MVRSAHLSVKPESQIDFACNRMIKTKSKAFGYLNNVVFEKWCETIGALFPPETDLKKVRSEVSLTTL